MKVKEKQEARRLRKEEGLSLKKIAEKIGAAKSSVSLWVRDIELTEEQKVQLNLYERQGYIIGNKKWSKTCKEVRKKYQEKGRQKIIYNDWEYAFGCSLYWGEGTKNKNMIGFTNSDPLMMTFFVNFLKKYFKVKKENISLYIQCYLSNGLKLEEIQKYWLDLLELPENCLRKTMIFKNKENGRRKNICLYGTCKIRVNSTELVQQIFGSIKEYMKDNSDRWLD